MSLSNLIRGIQRGQNIFSGELVLPLHHDGCNVLTCVPPERCLGVSYHRIIKSGKIPPLCPLDCTHTVWRLTSQCINFWIPCSCLNSLVSVWKENYALHNIMESAVSQPHMSWWPETYFLTPVLAHLPMLFSTWPTLPPNHLYPPTTTTKMPMPSTPIFSARNAYVFDLVSSGWVSLDSSLPILELCLWQLVLFVPWIPWSLGCHLAPIIWVMVTSYPFTQGT